MTVVISVLRYTVFPLSALTYRLSDRTSVPFRSVKIIDPQMLFFRRPNILEKSSIIVGQQYSIVRQTQKLTRSV